MQLYADEDFALDVVVVLRLLGHDVVTTQEDGRQGTSDTGILARAHALGRAVLTYNRRHFERLHRREPLVDGLCRFLLGRGRRGTGKRLLRRGRDLGGLDGGGGRVRGALAQLPPAPASLAASAGIELGRDYLFDMVRLGMSLYGGNAVPSRANPYRTVAALTSRVLQIRKLGAGETVGYGATFTATRAVTLAIVALGYADGMMRSASGKGSAAVGGVRVPIVGRISMDLLALDVSALPEQTVRRGTDVEFFGDTITLEDVLVSSYQSGGSEGSSALPTDQFSLNFGKIQFDYKPQDSKGGVGSPVVFKHDLKTGKG